MATPRTKGAPFIYCGRLPSSSSIPLRPRRATTAPCFLHFAAPTPFAVVSAGSSSRPPPRRHVLVVYAGFATSHLVDTGLASCHAHARYYGRPACVTHAAASPARRRPLPRALVLVLAGVARCPRPCRRSALRSFPPRGSSAAGSTPCPSSCTARVSPCRPPSCATPYRPRSPHHAAAAPHSIHARRRSYVVSTPCSSRVYMCVCCVCIFFGIDKM